MNALFLVLALIPAQCKDFPVIRMKGPVVINGSYLFEGVPKTYTTSKLPTYGLVYKRKCRAWLQKKDAEMFIDISQIKQGIITEKIYWGEVEVEESTRKSGPITVYFINPVDESKIEPVP